VLRISMVWPDMLGDDVAGLVGGAVRQVLGGGTTPIRLIGRPIRTAASMAPKTLAPPAMSYFISSISAAGLMEMPPASKVRPLPTSTMGLALSSPPRRHDDELGGLAAAAADGQERPMPSSCMSASSRTSVVSAGCSVARSRARSAR
jgi:hypothetical protein